MTSKEYADYQQSVASFFQREGVANLSTISDDNGTCEPFFSSRQCDCCGSYLGGNRYDANGYNPTTKEVYEYQICEDCAYYVEYGQLDDMTMMKIRHSQDSDPGVL